MYIRVFQTTVLRKDVYWMWRFFRGDKGACDSFHRFDSDANCIADAEAFAALLKEPVEIRK